MAIKQTNNPKVDLVYRKRKSAEEMKHQVITFALMIFLTLVAFVAVAYPKLSARLSQYHLFYY